MILLKGRPVLRVTAMFEVIENGGRIVGVLRKFYFYEGGDSDKDEQIVRINADDIRGVLYEVELGLLEQGYTKTDEDDIFFSREPLSWRTRVFYKHTAQRLQE